MLFFYLPVATTAPLSRRPVLVPILFYTCLGMFVLEAIPPVLDLMDAYLVFRPMNPTLLSSVGSTFLHGGFFHLIFNMLYLYIFGAAVETRLGWWRFLILYFGTALAGDMLFAALTPVELAHIGSIGASGAVYGVLAAYLLFFWDTKVRFIYFLWIFLYIKRGTAEISATLVIGFYALANLASLLLAGTESPVNYAAHMGGFAAGLGLALLLSRGLPVDEDAEERRKTRHERKEKRKRRESQPTRLHGPEVAVLEALAARRHADALQAYEKLSGLGGLDFLSTRVLLEVGGIYESRDNCPAALAVYKVAANRLEDTRHAPEAVFRMIVLYGERMDDVRHARALCDKFFTAFPVHPVGETVHAWIKAHPET